MAESFKGEMKMNSIIKKIACAVMAFTLVAGMFTGCKAKASEAVLPEYTSVKNESANLPEKGTVGDREYRIISQDKFGCYNKPRGYYIDMLEQENSPYYVVISGGTQTRSGAKIEIKDLGMQGSKLVIVVEETKATGEKYEGLECPCAVLELNTMPGELLIVNTSGKTFEKIQP